LRALVKHQDPSGAWHQVVDEPGSYREFSSTCMITFAMLRGMRGGRLSREEFEPIVARAWPAILARVGEKGQLFDVCVGTGKHKTLRGYFDRPAIFAPDPRGGGMALLVAVEMARASKR
jgi:rhamnogalacturonyl hydrolase YesR